MCVVRAGFAPGFRRFRVCLDRCARAVDVSELGQSMTLAVDLLTVEEAVEPQGFATGAALAYGRREELDPLRRESLHVQDIETLFEPIDEKVRRIRPVRPDYPSIPLLDGGRIHRHREDRQGGLRQGLLEGRGRGAHPLAPGRLAVDVAQMGPPPRSL